MTLEDHALKDFGRLRRELSDRHKEKMRHVRFVSQDEWLAQALANNVRGMMPTNRDILIAVRGNGLPSIGTHWTGLVVLDPEKRKGHSWFNEIIGELPIEATVHVYEGDREISRRSLDKLLVLLDQYELGDFRDVPNRCYDGAPTIVRLCTRGNKKIIKASANACDDGPENTVALSKVLWAIKAETRLV
ncbi:MAG TPA: hypothetical protein VG099_05985 [Gemmataceae bacterium]|jgi:hypothetical protein|nr:hypothetical protein [Gemmataceae bacterium]